MSTTGGAARLRHNIGLGPDDSLETQVDKLWRSNQQLWGEVDANRQEIEGKLGRTHAEIKEIKAAHDKRSNELHEVVKKVATSSPLFAYFGAWMAAVGTVLSTYTHDIAKAL